MYKLYKVELDKNISIYELSKLIIDKGYFFVMRTDKNLVVYTISEDAPTPIAILKHNVHRKHTKTRKLKYKNTGYILLTVPPITDDSLISSLGILHKIYENSICFMNYDAKPEINQYLEKLEQSSELEGLKKFFKNEYDSYI